MPKRRSLAVATTAALLSALLSTFSTASAGAVSTTAAGRQAGVQAAPTVIHGAGASRPVRAFVYTGSLRDLPTATRHRGPSRPSADELDGASTAPSNGPRDPLLATSGGNLPTSTGAMTPPIANFAGLGNVNGKVPPDTHGDVGISDYLQVVNDSFDVYRKSDGQELLGGSKNTNTLWAAAAPGTTCAKYNDGDAIARYDAAANRFVLTQFAFAVSGAGPSDECFAISQTSDPTAPGWFVYDFQVSATKWDDYPKISVWPDGYYATFNWGGGSGGGGAFAFDRSNMLNGNPATFQCFGCDADAYANLGSDPQLLFADWDGTAPAFGTPETFTRFVAPTTLKKWSMHVDWQSPLNTTLTALPDIAVANFTPVGGIAQPTPNGTTQAISCYPNPSPCSIPASPNVESVSDRLMSRFQYRNFGSYETAVVNHSVDVGGGQSGIRWYELRRGGSYGADWVLYQQGTYAPDTDSRWMGSIAMDQAGDIAVGYSISSTKTFPSIRAAGRLPSDPLGLLPQGEIDIKDGGGAQDFGWDGSNRARWGDYSAMNLDPTDGCTFWYTQEYIASPTYVNAGIANWNTQIASFRFPTCNPADLAISATATPSPVNAGSQLRYDLTVTNNGPATAHNVVVTDTLPAGVTYSTSTVACSQAAQVLTCPLGTMLSGQSIPIEISTQVAPGLDSSGGTTTITDTASVTATELDPDTTNNSASVAVTVNEQADLQVQKTCDSSVLAGQSGKCTIYVDNNGPSTARSVVLTDAATSNGTFTMSSATPSQGSCSGTPATGTSASTTCTLGNLAPATISGPGRATVVVAYTASEGQSIADTATATSPTPDPISANNTASASLPVTAVADLAITYDKTTPSSVNAGTALTFSVTVTNGGPSTAKTVVLQDALPAGLTVSNVTAPGATSCNVGVPGDPLQPVTCGFDVLGPAGSLTMTINTLVKPQTTGSLHSDAAVSAATFDPNNSNNYAHTDTAVNVVADLGLAMTAAPSPTVIAGTNLTYTATVSNGGPSTARSVGLFEQLPPGTTFLGTSISNGGAGTCAQVVNHPDQVQCQLNDLDPSGSVVVYTQVLVNASTLMGTALTINGTVSTSATDPVAGNNAASATSTADASADLAVGLTAPSHVYSASTTVTFTSSVSDSGPSDAQAVVLTTKLPGTKVGHYVSNNAPAGVCAVSATTSTTTVTCSFGTLAAGTGRAVQIVYYFQGNQKVQTITDSATSTTTDPNTANNAATWTVGPK
ncbi:MAG TPA: DUF11 domain-containing protein [Candidatus Limnocylindrales bacterium]